MRKWATYLNLEEGILKDVINLMKEKGKSISAFQKIVVLSFDEIYTSQKLEIDKKYEQVIGPHKTCQVGMARSLFDKWKQVIYYKADQPLTPHIVEDVISNLYDAGFTVVAITTDLGPSNSKIWTQLNIGINNSQNCFFLHPKDQSLKIFVFTDVSHLLKLVRNHFLDNGVIINRKCINKECIEEILQLQEDKDLKIVHRILKNNLDVSGTSRQKVGTAAKLFSKSTARAIA